MFKIEVIKECKLEELDFFENFYITEYNTMTPLGYNLTSGETTSRQSDETKARRRNSMIGKNIGKIYPRRDRRRLED
jgi:hypothetical protein